MSERTIENAVIKKVDLLIEDHDILTFFLTMEYAGGGQGFGGYKLDGEGAGNLCGKAIRSLLEVVGVYHWHDLVGRSVRVDHDWQKVYRLGHFLKDQWCDPETWVEKKP